MTTFTSTGILRYEISGQERRDGPRWIRLMCCNDLARYYRSQIHDKNFMLPMWGSHITVCNGRWERITNFKAWRKYEGKRIKFEYSNEIHYDPPFYFLYCFSEEIGDMREELGLSRIFARRPLHLTLGRNAPSGKSHVK